LKKKLNTTPKKNSRLTDSKWAERAEQAGPIADGAGGILKKRRADRWAPSVDDPLKMKGYLATPAVGLKEDLTAGSLSSSQGMHRLGENLLARRRGWGSRQGSPEGGGGRQRGGGGLVGGRGGFGRRILLWGRHFPRHPGALLRRWCSLARLNGGASGDLCAGKSFVGVSRGQGEGIWRERRPRRAWRERPPSRCLSWGFGSLPHSLQREGGETALSRLG
jgi:hypothetical protein